MKTLGIIEPVSFPDFKVFNINAKIDTGALTGALHCTKIHEQQDSSKATLFFSPFDDPQIEVNTTDFSIKYVRSSNGTRESRYFINTTITVQGQTYPITLSLADRSEMKRPVLIGRRFLRKYNFLVDVSKSS